MKYHVRIKEIFLHELEIEADSSKEIFYLFNKYINKRSHLPDSSVIGLYYELESITKRSKNARNTKQKNKFDKN